MNPFCRRKRARIALVVLTSIAASAMVACASTPNTGETTTMFVSPNAFTDFAGAPSSSGTTNAGVNGFITLKCGTLDCHGAAGEALRIYSQYGLRLADDAGSDIPGGSPTTSAEIFANYISTITVQPELTGNVFAGAEDPHVLILLRKPLGLERHKGGQVFTSGSNDDLCLTSWLEDGLTNDAGQPMTIDNAACNAAAQLP